MPNGVICGGAVDGSNQDGAIVTYQAMTILPDGSGSAAKARPGRTQAAIATRAATASHRRCIFNDIPHPPISPETPYTAPDTAGVPAPGAELPPIKRPNSRSLAQGARV